MVVLAPWVLCQMIDLPFRFAFALNIVVEIGVG